MDNREGGWNLWMLVSQDDAVLTSAQEDPQDFIRKSGTTFERKGLKLNANKSKVDGGGKYY